MSISQDIILFIIHLTEPVNPAYIISFNLIVIPLLYIVVEGFLGGRILKNILDIMKMEAVVPDSPEWTYYTYLQVLQDIVLMILAPILAVLGMIMSLTLIPAATEAALRLLPDLLKTSLEMATMHAGPVIILTCIFFFYRILSETVVIEENGKEIEIY
jgi:hypothetical protein